MAGALLRFSPVKKFSRSVLLPPGVGRYCLVVLRQDQVVKDFFISWVQSVLQFTPGGLHISVSLDQKLLTLQLFHIGDPVVVGVLLVESLKTKLISSKL